MVGFLHFMQIAVIVDCVQAITEIRTSFIDRD